MPTRIVYWNIERFGLNKINNPSQIMDSWTRKWNIGEHVTQTQAEIFVIVEQTAGVRPAAPVNGTLIAGNGMNGAVDFLSFLRFPGGAPGPPVRPWNLVPPLISGVGGVAEAISVFYRSDVLEFIGPWVWPAAGAGAGPAVDPAGGAVTGDYPAPVYNGAAHLDNFLPAGVVGGGVPTAGVPYTRLAGRWSFTDGGGAALDFPGAANRAPFNTMFREIATGRIIDLYSFHASPNFAAATGGTQQLAAIPEVGAAPAGNNAVVVVGDFNIDINSGAAAAAYGPLLAIANMNRMLQPALAPTVQGNYYLATHNKPYRQATPFNENAAAGVAGGFPGFGYVGSDNAHPGYDSIDNIFWVSAAAGAGANGTVINPVVGSPYAAAILPPPAGAPTGTIPFLQQLANPIPLPNGQPRLDGGGIYNIGARRQFEGWNNYRMVRSTSDHMALAIDI